MLADDTPGGLYATLRDAEEAGRLRAEVAELRALVEKLDHAEAAAQLEAHRLRKENAELRDAVGHLKLTNAALRGDLDHKDCQGRALADRVAALEERSCESGRKLSEAAFYYRRDLDKANEINRALAEHLAAASEVIGRRALKGEG